MDDELKGLLGQILTVVEGMRVEVSRLGGRVDQLAQDVALSNRATRHSMHGDLEQLDMTDVDRLRLSGKIELVADMMLDHLARYHGQGGHRRADASLDQETEGRRT